MPAIYREGPVLSIVFFLPGRFWAQTRTRPRGGPIALKRGVGYSVAMKTDVGVVMVTFPHAEAAAAVIDGLLENRLAACVQTMPVHSVYRWKGAVNRDAEVLALIKTQVALYPEVEAFIRSRHSYEIPEILLLPATAGFSGYVQWVGNETKKGAAPEED